MKRLLVVDDERDFLDVACMILQEHGFKVEGIANPDDILPAIKNFKPDLILMDIKMGNFDGRKTCAEIKESPDTSHIKIILNSAFTDAKYFYQKYHADDFILKPYDVEDLVSRIRKLLSK
jgi:DNA-binding response OmpR family regulator